MYDYATEKPALLTEKGQVMFLEIRDRVIEVLREAGAVSMGKAIKGTCGDSWLMLACVDRLVEIGELKELPQQEITGQQRVFVAGDKWRRQRPELYS